MVFHRAILNILNSRTKQKLSGFLLKHEALMSEREISSVSGVSHMSVNRIMRELAEMNFVHSQRAGNVNLWRANRKSYVFHVLSRHFSILMDSEAPLEDLKREILKSLPLSHIVRVILFGSIASRTEKSSSDIDLFIQVKNPDDKRQVEPAIEKLAILCLERFGNVLSPYILTGEELSARSDLKLISGIQAGVLLYRAKEVHES
ncbi:MAG: nucleotidyltransferase domain-containing protein [Candidatus Aminicenantales bacterium]